MRLAILDVETNGLDPKRDEVIEVGVVLLDTELLAVLETYSGLMRCGSNAAYPANRIPTHALASAPDSAVVWDRAADVVRHAGAICAYHAAFDRSFAERPLAGALDRFKARFPMPPWFCAMEDLKWSATGLDSGHASLTARALAHGCGVATAHRAIEDCLLLARLLVRVAHVLDGTPPHFAEEGKFAKWLAAGLKRGQAPRIRVVSLAPFEQKETVKEHGFKWDLPECPKKWSRLMVEDEIAAAQFPFKVQVMR